MQQSNIHEFYMVYAYANCDELFTDKDLALAHQAQSIANNLRRYENYNEYLSLRMDAESKLAFFYDRYSEEFDRELKKWSDDLETTNPRMKDIDIALINYGVVKAVKVNVI